MYIVFITVPTQKAAKDTVRRLIDLRLAACVTIIGNVSSVFYWKGKVNKAKEILLIAKTKNSLKRKIIREIKKVHPYECPEIVFIDIKAGNKDYIKWISDNCGSS